MARLIPLLFLFLFACGEGLPEVDSTAWEDTFLQDSIPLEIVKEYELLYATGFKIERIEGNHLVTVYDDSIQIAQYLLHKNKAPKSVPGVQNIKIPLTSIACLSTTYLPFIDRIGEITTVNGVANAQFVRNKSIRKQIENKTTANISASEEINLEQVLEIDPEVLMVYPFNSPDYSRLEDMGIQLFYNTEYKEAHPLGQAEWIKLFGLLYNKEAEAFGIFETITRSYNSTLEIAKNAAPVRVMAGSIFNELWSAPGGNSMGVKLFEDAGGKFIWKDDRTGSYTKDLEVVIEDSEQADVMVLISSYQGKFTTEALLEENPKYRLMKPFTDEHVIHCNTANVNYFEDALLEPDIIIKDLVHLFHRELLPDHKLKYFWHVKPRP
ncbi:MAG: iron complex transport system substrate-binding protein [Parvicellaceae bacterium]|jgi:iron complex transport system substrate-binding protein